MSPPVRVNRFQANLIKPPESSGLQTLFHTCCEFQIAFSSVVYGQRNNFH